MTAALDNLKPALRQRLRAERVGFVESLDVAARDALERALASVVQSVTSGVKRPASYAAQGSEINPLFIEDALFPLSFPRVSDGFLSFHLSDRAALCPGFGNIPEPDARAPQIIPDLVLVPLVGATLSGQRLGQGGGYYDRTLARLRATGSVIVVGLAYEVQIVADLPADPWDEPLDWVATPKRLVECARYR
jgi:5-formyltetrahydrofolate cyclo-ligase